MKRISIALAILLIASPAFAEPLFYQPPTPVPQVAATPGRIMNGKAGDEYGRQQVIVSSISSGAGPITLPTPVPITPAPMITVLPTALPTAYSTPQFANSAPLSTFTVDNVGGDQDVWCALYGSAVTDFSVPAHTSYTDNVGDRGKSMTGAIGCIHPGATPAVGSLKIYGE